MAKYFKYGIIVGLLLIAVFAGLTVIPSQAQTPSTWSKLFITPSLPSGVDDAYVAVEGEKVGVAYTLTGSTTGFALYDPVLNTWTLHNDITGSASTTLHIARLFFDGARWLILVTDTGADIAAVYVSTNDGASWSKTVLGFGGHSDGDMDAFPFSGGLVVVGQSLYAQSLDVANTKQCLTDLNTDPSVSPHACVSSSNCPLLMSGENIGPYDHFGSVGFQVWSPTTAGPGSPTIAIKSDDGGFWTSVINSSCSSGGFAACTTASTNEATQCENGIGIISGGIMARRNTHVNGAGALQLFSNFPQGCVNNPCGGSGESLPISSFGPMMGSCTTTASSGVHHVAFASQFPYLQISTSLGANNPGTHEYLGAYKCAADSFFKADLMTSSSATPFNVLSNSGVNALPTSVAFTSTKVYIAYQNLGLSNRLELLTAKITDLSPQGPAPTQLGLSNVLGFDVDSFDQNIIVRQLIPTTTHEIVQTINPSSLTLIETSNNDNTNCGVVFVGFCTPDCNSSRVDGVGTLFDGLHIFSTFYNCASDHTTNRIHIRDGSLSAPNQETVPCNDGSGTSCASVCNGLNFCDFDLLNLDTNCDPFGSSVCTISADDCAAGISGNAVALPSTMRFMDKLSMALWDWSNQQDPSDATPKHATIGFTYGDMSGNVGAIALTQNRNNQDCYKQLSVVYSPGQTITSMCSFNNFLNGHNVIVATDGSGGATKTYEQTLSTGFKTTGAGFNVYYPVMTLSNTGLGTSPLNGANHSSCAAERWGTTSGCAGGLTKCIHYNGNVALLSIGNTVYHTHVTTDNDSHTRYGVDWSMTQSDSGNAVAMSGDGHWGAVQTTSTTTTTQGIITIINATNDNIVGTVQVPSVVVSGTAIPCCLYMEMDDTGQFLYAITGTLANTQFLYKWDIHALTTHTSVPPGNTPIFNGGGTGGISDDICTNPIGGVSPDCSSAIDTSTNNNPNGNPNPPVASPTTTSNNPNGGLNQNDNILGINITATSKGLNISKTVVLILIAVVLMGVFFIWIYRNTDSIIGGVFGAFMGFVIAIAMGLLPQWVMIVIVLVLLIIFGKMIFGGFYPGGEE